MRNQLTYALVQGITEMLPISSGLHLNLVGAQDIYLLHLVTGLVGILYVSLYGRKPLRITLNSFVDLITNIHWSYFLIAFSISVCLKFKNVDPVLLSAFAALMLVIEFAQKGTREVTDFTGHDMAWSILGNVLGLIPGASRLGSAYMVLRIRGFKPLPALTLSAVQGVIISVPLIFKHGSSVNELATLPNLLCGVIFFSMNYIILHRKSQWISNFIIVCAVYRLALSWYIR
jgi:undecaprenyl pyrophosphate phosphatase UppP